MSDFIAETRPRRLQVAPICPNGFVAELRPSSRRRAVPSESPTKWALNSHTTHVKSFDHSNQITKDNYETDLNDLLQTKCLSKDKITNVLHSSVVTLVNTVLKGYSVTRIEGSISVQLADSREILLINLNENYGVSTRSDESPNNALNDGITLKDSCRNWNQMQSSYCESMQSCHREMIGVTGSGSTYGTLNTGTLETPSTGMMEGEYNHLPRIVTESESEKYGRSNLPQNIRRVSEGSDKSDNDEESGYSTSSERESLNSSPRKTSVDSIGNRIDFRIDESPEEDLVIDESPENLTTEETVLEQPETMTAVLPVENRIKPISRIDQGNVIEYDEYINFDERNGMDEQTVPTDNRHGVTQEILSAQNCNSYSDAVTDVPMDLSGDCKVNEDAKTAEDEDVSGLKKSTPVPCKKCDAVLLDTEDYGKHTLEHHQLHACPTCFKDFSSKNNLKRHVRIHTGSRPYKCGQCEMSFARKDDLKGHTLTHDFSKPFRCSLCKKGYTDRACVKNHMSKEHCSRLMRICPQCGESFDREDTFLEHKKSHPSLKQFSCDTCPFIGTNHLMALKHKLLHSHKLFSCKPCNAYFADPFDYTKHVRKHKKNKEYSFYVCCFCNTTLPTYEQFVRHEYSHAQGKFHECIVCKKQFKNKVLMLEHTLVHSNPSISTEQLFNPIQKKKTTENVSTDTSMDCLEEKTLDLPLPQLSVSTHTEMDGISKPIDDQICHVPVENHSPTPTLVQNVENINMCDGELLDLSLKPLKSVNHFSSVEQSPVADQSEQTSVADISSPKTSSMSPCVPRNGYTVIDARVIGQETSPRSDSFANGLTASKSKDEEFQVVWQSPSFSFVEDSKKLENLQNVKQNLLIQRGKSPKLPIDDKIMQRANDTRYKPYGKHGSMVTFISKYMAARGSIPNENLLKDIGNTPSGLRLKNNPLPSLTKSLLQMDNRSEVSPRFEVSENTDEERGSPSMIYGLTGKPCLAPVGKTSPIIKQEIADDYLHHHRRQSPTSSITFTDSAAHHLSAGYHQTHQHLLPPHDLVERSKSLSPTNTPMPSLNNNSNNNNNNIVNDSNKCNSNARNECDICKTIFESFSQLESHSVTEHSRYLCEFCGKGFTARPNRDRHVRYHTGERPYKCELCPSAFFRGDDLKYHRTTRHPMEQISCNRCTASFTWQKDLERHLRHSKCVATA